jgi:hypothetical protein
MLEDQKRSMRPQQPKASTGSRKIGLSFLGSNYMQAFTFYQNLAKTYT